MIDIEVALDFLRTEGWGDPVWQDPALVESPSSTQSRVRSPAVQEPGRFVNRCDRCLEFRQSSLLKLGWSRAWLCEPCRGPNPPVVVFEKPKTWQQINKARKELFKAAEREKRKIEREGKRKAKHPAVSRLRGVVRQEGNAQNAVAQST